MRIRLAAVFLTVMSAPKKRAQSESAGARFIAFYMIVGEEACASMNYFLGNSDGVI